MTRLLVSVRDVPEALEALAGGAQLIDIKEPARGALGAADVAIWRDVIAAVDGRTPVSAALGELIDDECFALAPHSQMLALVKVGLSGLRDTKHLAERWRELQRCLPLGPQLVAVAYADDRAARAPPPREVIRLAIQLQMKTLLIDTYTKVRGDLFTWLLPQELSELLDTARAGGMQIALAGSLRAETLPQARGLAPDWIAVRGAACAADRQSAICRRRVAELAMLLREPIPRREKNRAVH
jgi:uncharacterized protein (UPF0264 family)